MLKEFRAFMLRGNIVELAVAVVIGTAFGALVTSLVANLLTPIVAAIIGKPDFSNLTFTINDSVFRYGSFLNALIAFVSIAAADLLLRRASRSTRSSGAWASRSPRTGAATRPPCSEEIRDILKDAARMTHHRDDRRARSTPAPWAARSATSTCSRRASRSASSTRTSYDHEREFERAVAQVRAAMAHGVRTIVDPGVHGPRARRAARDARRRGDRHPARAWRPASTASTTRSSPSTSRPATRTTSPTPSSTTSRSASRARR